MLDRVFCQSGMKFFCDFDVERLNLTQISKKPLCKWKLISLLFGLNSIPFILEETLQMNMSKYDFTYHNIDGQYH